MSLLSFFKTLICTLLIACICLPASAQDNKITDQKMIFFPYPMTRNWQVSVGLVNTTLVHEVTEEARFRVPALDLHLNRRLAKSWILAGRLTTQILQHNASFAVRYAKPINNKLSISLGNELGFWFGSIKVEGNQTTGRGWSNIPSLSIGYNPSGRILVTFRAEQLLSFGKEYKAGDTKLEIGNRLFNGSAFSFIMEQPFFAKKSIALGFRALYTNFLWQTWAITEDYDRNLFYPQLIFGVLL